MALQSAELNSNSTTTATSELTIDITSSPTYLNSTLSPALKYTLVETIALVITFTILILWIIIGNATILISLLRNPRLRKTQSNLLIGNLALSDLLLGAFVLPFSGMFDLYGWWPLGKATCHFWLVTDVLLSTASIWGLLVIAIDRYSAIFYPVWYRAPNWTPRVVIYIAMVWIVSTLTSVPPLFGFGSMIQGSYSSGGIKPPNCELFDTLDFVLFSSSLTFILPSVALIVIYVKIFSEIRNRTERRNKLAPKGTDRSLLSHPVKQHAHSLAENGKFTNSELSTRSMVVPLHDPASNDDSTIVTTSGQTTPLHGCVKSDEALNHSSRSRCRSREQKSRRALHARFLRTLSAKTCADTKEEKATRIMLFLVIGFQICWLPFFCMYITRSVLIAVCPHCASVPVKFQVFVIWLGYLNSAINPILYAACNRHFRQAFKNTWTCQAS